MKKLIGLILFFSLSIIFLAYSKHESVNKSISSAEEAPTKDDVYIDMQVQKYGYKSNLGEEIFEIPLFVSRNGSNKEIEKLNSNIAPLLNLYNGNYGFEQDKDTWEVKSYPFTSDSYLQVITTARIYPNSENTQGEVISFNYDIKNEKMLTLDDAYNKSNTDKESLIKEIKTAYYDLDSANNTKLKEVSIKGFLLEENTTKFFLRISMKDIDSNISDKIFTYDCNSGVLEDYKGFCLIDPKEPDSFEPYLSYERNDIKEKYYSNFVLE